MSAAHDRQPIGARLDQLGIRAELPDDALIASALVAMKILMPDGTTRIALSFSEGLDLTERAGLVHLAREIETDRALAMRRNQT